MLEGQEPKAGSTLRRSALCGVRKDAPLYPVGERITFVASSPQARSLSTGTALLIPELSRAPGWQAQDLERSAQVMERGIHSLITVPLRVGPLVMGVVNFWRSERPEPFDQEELVLAEELVARAAVSIDNARRYTREHTMAVTLQRSLLPRNFPAQSALDLAHRYLPAQAGVGGDWFDVLPLSGARVALVVGDVVGHGLHAAATMGRLRTAVRNFSALDLPPDEILAYLDELVDRIDQDEAQDDAAAITGATCLYAIYDPVSRMCTMARAGHPPPAVAGPDGEVVFPEVPAGPRSASAVCPSRRPRWSWPRAADWCCTRTAWWKAGNGTSTPASRSCGGRWPRPATSPWTPPAGPCWRRCCRTARTTTWP